MTSRHDDDDQRRPDDDRRRDDDRRIEDEVRRQRRVDPMATILGRDGGGHLAGASPTPRLKRALLEIEHWLDEELVDHAGALQVVILRRLEADPEALAAGLGQPARTVAAWLDRLLARPARVADLVREVDMEWGRREQERPRFERPGEPPADDDPYTVASVTATLTGLRQRC
jgi:hypothetical protein